MTGNNFALELTVGIDDLFTKEQQRIERGAKSLEKQFERLQKTSGDVTEYRRMKEGLEQIGKEAGTTSREFQEQERQLQKYADSLRRAEVNVSKLTQEQRRLNEQLREAKQAAEGVRSVSSDMANLVGTIAGVAVVSGTVMRGVNGMVAPPQNGI
ncbi:Chromosome partition protein Smc [compost metagenome]